MVRVGDLVMIAGISTLAVLESGSEFSSSSLLTRVHVIAFPCAAATLLARITQSESFARTSVNFFKFVYSSFVNHDFTGGE